MSSTYLTSSHFDVISIWEEKDLNLSISLFAVIFQLAHPTENLHSAVLFESLSIQYFSVSKR